MFPLAHAVANVVVRAREKRHSKRVSRDLTKLAQPTIGSRLLTQEANVKQPTTLQARARRNLAQTSLHYHLLHCPDWHSQPAVQSHSDASHNKSDKRSSQDDDTLAHKSHAKLSRDVLRKMYNALIQGFSEHKVTLAIEWHSTPSPEILHKTPNLIRSLATVSSRLECFASPIIYLKEPLQFNGPAQGEVEQKVQLAIKWHVQTADETVIAQKAPATVASTSALPKLDLASVVNNLKYAPNVKNLPPVVPLDTSYQNKSEEQRLIDFMFACERSQWKPFGHAKRYWLKNNIFHQSRKGKQSLTPFTGTFPPDEEMSAEEQGVAQIVNEQERTCENMDSFPVDGSTSQWTVELASRLANLRERTVSASTSDTVSSGDARDSLSLEHFKTPSPDEPSSPVTPPADHLPLWKDLIDKFVGSREDLSCVIATEQRVGESGRDNASCVLDTTASSSWCNLPEDLFMTEEEEMDLIIAEEKAREAAKFQQHSVTDKVNKQDCDNKMIEEDDQSNASSECDVIDTRVGFGQSQVMDAYRFDDMTCRAYGGQWCDESDDDSEYDGEIALVRLPTARPIIPEYPQAVSYSECAASQKPFVRFDINFFAEGMEEKEDVIMMDHYDMAMARVQFDEHVFDDPDAEAVADADTHDDADADEDADADDTTDSDRDQCQDEAALGPVDMMIRLLDSFEAGGEVLRAPQTLYMAAIGYDWMPYGLTQLYNHFRSIIVGRYIKGALILQRYAVVTRACEDLSTFDKHGSFPEFDVPSTCQDLYRRGSKGFVRDDDLDASVLDVGMHFPKGMSTYHPCNNSPNALSRRFYRYTPTKMFIVMNIRDMEVCAPSVPTEVV